MARSFFDEMNDAQGVCRAHYQDFSRWLANTPPELLAQRRREADLLFHRAGITFTLYGDEQDTERLIPFDIIPRSIPASEWSVIERGCIQRVNALNMFLADIYHDQRIIKAGIIPADQVLGNEGYQQAMVGLDLHRGIYSHISGVDLVRDGDGTYYVLEDNLRTPSGVSYMLEDRKMMMRLFLAREMGVELVEGADLFVHELKVFMRTTDGPKAVDVIYRRIDDAFLDPEAYNPDSMLGVPGLVAAYCAGNVVLANAIGTGVADDKSIYPYVPAMIRFYLDEEPLLQNVPTFQCRKPEELSHVLANLEHLVVKETQGSGGYGMLVGPASTAAEIEDFRQRIKARPHAYIAQPTLSLSTCPTFVENGIAPRHIDLRPFVLSGKETRLVPGGLTRVALREGSLIVNSSQGGGTKDTWVVEG
jgi:uncharacterized circularly permuted ATP-grasp superfamily protein